MEAEFRPDENVAGEKNFDSNSGMHLEMIRASDRRGGSGADGGPYASALRVSEAGARASESTLQLQRNSLHIKRRVNTVDVIKRLAGV